LDLVDFNVINDDILVIFVNPVLWCVAVAVLRVLGPIPLVQDGEEPNEIFQVCKAVTNPATGAPA
jgi:hypothetical protein